jgi:hypothetical protein
MRQLKFMSKLWQDKSFAAIKYVVSKSVSKELWKQNGDVVEQTS